MNELTTDSILGGKIKIVQEKNGYRFSIDAVLLAYFAGASKAQRILELGAGCGVISLIMAVLNERATIFGVEVQESLVNLAWQNISINKLDSRIRIMHHDMREIPKKMSPRETDLVVSNPPYRELGSGRINPESQKAAARHEISGSLADAARAAAHVLKPGGRFAVIYPAVRLVHLIQELKKYDLEPKRLQMIHSNIDSNARLVMAEAVKNGGAQLDVQPPLFIYDMDGEYSSQVKDMLYPD